MNEKPSPDMEQLKKELDENFDKGSKVQVTAQPLFDKGLIPDGIELDINIGGKQNDD